MYCSSPKAQPEATSFVLQLQMNPEAITEAADSVLDLQSLGFRLLGFAFGFYTHTRRRADVGSPSQQLTVVEQPTRYQVHITETEVRTGTEYASPGCAYKGNRQDKLTWTQPQKAQETRGLVLIVPTPTPHTGSCFRPCLQSGVGLLGTTA